MKTRRKRTEPSPSIPHGPSRSDAGSDRGPALVLHGDCLDLIPKAVDRAGGSFDLVYVDPPFNAGGTRGARVGRGERVSGKSAYQDAWGGLPAFLEMLVPRLSAMRDAMSADGSAWIHLDFRAVHDVKVAADRIFGRSAFRGEVVWVPGNGA